MWRGPGRACIKQGLEKVNVKSENTNFCERNSQNTRHEGLPVFFKNCTNQATPDHAALGHHVSNPLIVFSWPKPSTSGWALG